MKETNANLFFSLECDGEDTSAKETVVMPNKAKNPLPIEGEDKETIDTAKEVYVDKLEELLEKISELTNNVGSNIDSMESFKTLRTLVKSFEDGLNYQAAALYHLHRGALIKQAGINFKSQLSLESFGGNMTQKQATKLSMEEDKEIYTELFENSKTSFKESLSAATSMVGLMADKAEKISELSGALSSNIVSDDSASMLNVSPEVAEEYKYFFDPDSGIVGFEDLAKVVEYNNTVFTNYPNCDVSKVKECLNTGEGLTENMSTCIADMVKEVTTMDSVVVDDGEDGIKRVHLTVAGDTFNYLLTSPKGIKFFEEKRNDESSELKSEVATSDITKVLDAITKIADPQASIESLQSLLNSAQELASLEIAPEVEDETEEYTSNVELCTCFLNSYIDGYVLAPIVTYMYLLKDIETILTMIGKFVNKETDEPVDDGVSEL